MMGRHKERGGSRVQDKTLLPQRRRRSLAELDARILGAEANQAKAARCVDAGLTPPR